MNLEGLPRLPTKKTPDDFKPSFYRRVWGQKGGNILAQLIVQQLEWDLFWRVTARKDGIGAGINYVWRARFKPSV
jgi:hypothetical protein